MSAILSKGRWVKVWAACKPWLICGLLLNMVYIGSPYIYVAIANYVWLPHPMVSRGSTVTNKVIKFICNQMGGKRHGFQRITKWTGIGNYPGLKLKVPGNYPGLKLKVPGNYPGLKLKVPGNCPGLKLKVPGNYPGLKLKVPGNYPGLKLKVDSIPPENRCR